LIFWALFYQEKSARKIGAQATPPSSTGKAKKRKQKTTKLAFLLYLCGPCLTTDTAENRQGETIQSLDFWFFSSRKRTREIGAQAIPKQHQKRKKKA
jgi:hypothetical protein